MHNILTEYQVRNFLENGILVVEDVLTPLQLEETREGLSKSLLEYGVDVNNLTNTASNIRYLSSTNGAGGILDVYYPQWKMKIALNEKNFRITTELWQAAFICNGESIDDLSKDDYFKFHPYGIFDSRKGYAYIDRIGYRLSTVLSEELGSERRQIVVNNLSSVGDYNIVDVSKRNKNTNVPLQRCLCPHLDCCPYTVYSPLNNDKEKKLKWRPIQCFISLTENMKPNTGGFEAAPGFHRQFMEWKRHILPSRVISNPMNKRRENTLGRNPSFCVGEYMHMRQKEDKDVIQMIRHIAVPAGSAVFWDNRIPHGNSYRNDTDIPREVVYCSFLPDVDINRKFIRSQLEDWKRRRLPKEGDRWVGLKENVTDFINGIFDEIEVNGMKEDECQHFTDFEKKLMGIKDW